MTEIPDEILIERAANEPELFGMLFDRHFDAIARFCIRRVGPSQGEDLAGDVFRWAFEHLDTFNTDRGAVRSWLFGIANNQVRNARRRSDRRDLAYLRWSRREEPRAADLSSDIAAAVDAAQDLCAISAVLELESSEDVETLLLFAWEELSYAEIAEVLSIPIGTVSSRISRIRRHLRDVIDGGLARTNCTTPVQGGYR